MAQSAIADQIAQWRNSYDVNSTMCVIEKVIASRKQGGYGVLPIDTSMDS